MKRTKEIINNRGITMISLIVTIAVMVIIASTTVYTSLGRFEINNLNKMYNDLELLADKVSSYYLKYGALPVIRDGENNPIPYTHTNIDVNKNPNDNENYYIIDLSALEAISLNYGKEGFQKPNGSDDVYIINETSHQIYYVKGIKTNGEVFYTRYDGMAENNDAIPPSKPQINIVSGRLNSSGVYNSEVEVEIVAGKDNWSGTARTTYTVNDGTETELTADNSIYHITEDGTYTIKVKTTDTVGNTSENTLQLTTRIMHTGDFVNYNVTYTDAYINKEYTVENGWRYVGKDDKGNHLIISTGIPAKLYYLYYEKQNGKWWFITDEGTDGDASTQKTLKGFRNLLGSDYAFYTGEETYYGLQAAAGLYHNFENIKFKYSTDTRGANLGFFTAINNGTAYSSTENTSREVTGGELFNLYQEKGAKVRLLTLPEVNKAIGRTDVDNRSQITIQEDAKGLYRLDQLQNTNGMSQYAYNTAYYWLASPALDSGARNYGICDIWSTGVVSQGYDTILGVRPVVVLPSNTEFIDDNNDGIWEIVF